jgi:hypothetical protein
MRNRLHATSDRTSVNKALSESRKPLPIVLPAAFSTKPMMIQPLRGLQRELTK